MNQLYCANCQVPLSGGSDTYGSPGNEMCQSCYLSPLLETEATIPLDDYEASLEYNPQTVRQWQSHLDKTSQAFSQRSVSRVQVEDISYQMLLL